MAFTKESLGSTVWGNKRVYIYSMTADAATDAISTDLGTVDYCWMNIVSMTTTAAALVADAGPAGTAIAGSVGASGFTSGDAFTLFAVGR